MLCRYCKQVKTSFNYLKTMCLDCKTTCRELVSRPIDNPLDGDWEIIKKTGETSIRLLEDHESYYYGRKSKGSTIRLQSTWIFRTPRNGLHWICDSSPCQDGSHKFQLDKECEVIPD